MTTARESETGILDCIFVAIVLCEVSLDIKFITRDQKQRRNVGLAEPVCRILVESGDFDIKRQ